MHVESLHFTDWPGNNNRNHAPEIIKLCSYDLGPVRFLHRKSSCSYVNQGNSLAIPMTVFVICSPRGLKGVAVPKIGSGRRWLCALDHIRSVELRTTLKGGGGLDTLSRDMTSPTHLPMSTNKTIIFVIISRDFWFISVLQHVWCTKWMRYSNLTVCIDEYIKEKFLPVRVRVCVSPSTRETLWSRDAEENRLRKCSRKGSESCWKTHRPRQFEGKRSEEVVETPGDYHIVIQGYQIRDDSLGHSDAWEWVEISSIQLLDLEIFRKLGYNWPKLECFGQPCSQASFDFIVRLCDESGNNTSEIGVDGVPYSDRPGPQPLSDAQFNEEERQTA